ncbi:MAG: hypothetical protein ACHQF0_17550 [Chitinophagales bacterium]
MAPVVIFAAVEEILKKTKDYVASNSNSAHRLLRRTLQRSVR